MYLTLVVEGHAVWLPAVVMLGVGVGLIAGMFGVGGGFLLVPLMHVALGVPLPAAVGAALCATIANGLGSFLRYRRMGHAEHRFDIVLMGGSLLGVDAGTRLLGSLQGAGDVDIAGHTMRLLPLVLTSMYSAVFLAIVAILWCKPVPGADDPHQPGPLARLAIGPLVDLPAAGIRGVSGLVIGYIGFANGLLAGMLGIGGGICLVPIMLYGFGFSIQKAAGTGIMVLLVVAVIGTLQHARIGNVHLGLAIPMMIGSALAAQVGASLTRSLSTALLRKALAVVMLITLAALIFKLVR